MIYSTIQPIILPFMIIYFGLYYLAFRYQFLYVYRQPFDSGGFIYPRIIDQIYVGLIIYEIVMMGLFVLQKAAGQATIMFVVLLASIGAIVISRNNVFKPLIQYLPVEAFNDNGEFSSTGEHHQGDKHTGVGGRGDKEVVGDDGVEMDGDVEKQAAAAADGYRGVGSTGGPSTPAFSPGTTSNLLRSAMTDSTAFMNPGLRTQQQPVWLPRDPAGFVDQEVTELDGANIANTTDSATMDAKGKITVEVSQQLTAPGEEFWE